MAIDTERRGSLSGLTDDEAKEFHAIFVKSFGIFTAIAAVAHLLVWMWRPWIPGARGYTDLTDSATQMAQFVVSTLA